jgi:transposase-like protein
MTLLELTQSYSTDDTCREILTRLRWPHGVKCLRCSNSNVWWVESRKQFTCSACAYQFSALAGTIFHDSHLPIPTWFLAVLLLCEAKKGMSALQLKRTLWGEHKGSYKTAWYLCHRVRAAMASAEKAKMNGVVEMDETYVGGVIHSRHWKRPEFNTKQVVVGIKQRNGDLRFFHAEDAKLGTLAKYIRENVAGDVDVIMTDELPAYPGAIELAGHWQGKHQTVNHSAKVYVDGDITTNGIESAFSLLKRGIIGSWHKVSAKHLPAYLEEMTFRFNRRGRSDLFVDTLRHMVTADPLTFEELTA